MYKSMGLSVKEKFKIDFQDGDYGGHLVFHPNDFSYFLSTSPPDAFYQVSSQFQMKKQKIDFQDGHHGSLLGLPIRKM